MGATRRPSRHILVLPLRICRRPSTLFGLCGRRGRHAQLLEELSWQMPLGERERRRCGIDLPLSDQTELVSLASL